MLKILIVDDEEKIREVVKEYGIASGYEVDEASNGKEALEKIEAIDYDCVILDIMMPVLDGFSALKEIKARKDVSIIMLSARQEEDDKLYSFDIGVDDYVTKPFSPKELMARIKTITSRKQIRKNEKYSYKTLVLDTLGRTLKIDDELVLLTPKELDLLIYLIENKNIALDREKILEAIWGYDYPGDGRTVDTHIKMLRHNLGPYKDLIKTVRAVGYKFED